MFPFLMTMVLVNGTVSSRSNGLIIQCVIAKIFGNRMFDELKEVKYFKK